MLSLYRRAAKLYVPGVEQAAAAATGAAAATSGLVVEPVTRVAGALALRAGADARCGVRFYRGYEPMMRGRDLRDAIYITSRCCGYHGGQHAVAAAQAVEMALDAAPPPMAIAIRNLGMAAETIHAEAAHLVLMVAPDLCQQAVAALLPEVWQAAQRTEAPNARFHGMGTIGEIMYALNPMTGRWYLEALKVARVPYTMYAILQGKYPHPQAIVIGGVATKVNTSSVHDYLVRLLSLVDPAKQVATMVVDLLDFLVAAVPALADVGARPAALVDTGQYDDSAGYDPGLAGLADRGDRRWAAPGVVVDGRLVTSDLAEIAAGFEESDEHSFYGAGGAPEPGPVDWDGRYSWCRTVRWKGQVLETGPGARLWATALRGRIHDNPLITVRGGAIQLDLPEAALPRLTLEWRPPTAWNAVERNRARLYSIVFHALVAANQVLTVLDLQKKADVRTEAGLRNEARGRGERRGAGFAGDGVCGHWVEIGGQKVSSYRVIAPSTINLGPGGPAEQALAATPELPGAAGALIALRSFDPCGNCASH